MTNILIGLVIGIPLGSLLGAFLMHQFGKQDITNEYSHNTFRNKTKGTGNIQQVENTTKMEINGGMKWLEVRKIWRQLKKDEKS